MYSVVGKDGIDIYKINDKNLEFLENLNLSDEYHPVVEDYEIVTCETRDSE